jgi:hypothetical protein
MLLKKGTHVTFTNQFGGKLYPNLNMNKILIVVLSQFARASKHDHTSPSYYIIIHTLQDLIYMLYI